MDVIKGVTGATVGGLLALTIGGTAWAQSPVRLDSSVYVERNRGPVRSLVPADKLSRGDRVVTILSWQQARREGFTLVNPMPRQVAYQGSAFDSEQVSVDGGRTWGRLGDLMLGSRLATAEDVSHVRWRVPAARAAEGRIAYSGIVR